MRIKKILSLIAFSAAFFSSVMLIGLPKDNFFSRLSAARRADQTRQNIKTFLWQDIDNGRLINQTVSSLDDIDSNFQTAFNVSQLADATEEYVEASQSMDDSALPLDFQTAWQSHMNAWHNQVDYLNEVKATAEKYPVTTRNNKVNGYLFNVNSSNRYQTQALEINRTWYEVLRVGRKYGAYVPVD